MENKIVKIENNKLTMTEKDREELKKLIQINLESELRIKEIKAQYKEAFEETGTDKYIAEGLSVKLKAGYTTKRFDSKRFKEECPDIYEQYMKESSVSSSVILEVE